MSQELTIREIKEYYLWKLLVQHKHYSLLEERDMFTVHLQKNNIDLKIISNLRKAYSVGRMSTMKMELPYLLGFKDFYREYIATICRKVGD